MRRMQNGIESDRREKKTTRNSLEHRGHMGHIGHLCEKFSETQDTKWVGTRFMENGLELHWTGIWLGSFENKF